MLVFKENELTHDGGILIGAENHPRSWIVIRRSFKVIHHANVHIGVTSVVRWIGSSPQRLDSVLSAVLISESQRSDSRVAEASI